VMGTSKSLTETKSAVTHIKRNAQDENLSKLYPTVAPNKTPFDNQTLNNSLQCEQQLQNITCKYLISYNLQPKWKVGQLPLHIIRYINRWLAVAAFCLLREAFIL
jgi:hypothetical protein